MKLAQVARELNVAHILEGSVRKAGNKVRITAQLIDARSDRSLWSDSRTRRMRTWSSAQSRSTASASLPSPSGCSGNPWVF